MSNKVGNVAEEATKVLTGTTLKMRSNLDLVTDTVKDKVAAAGISANTLLGTVSDMTNIRRKRPSTSSLDRGVLNNLQFSQSFSSNYDIDAGDEDHPSAGASSEDVSQVLRNGL